MYNLETFYPTITAWFNQTYDHLEPAVVYPFPYGSDNPDDTVFASSYEYPKTILLLYDQEPFWSSIRWLDHWAPRFAEWGSTVVLITTQQWGTNLDHYVQKYKWHTVNYQHHYLAARDWFRGYRNHPLLQRLDQRNPTHHAVCYNRLFAENRPHRCQVLADIIDNLLLEKIKVSFPSTDPLTDQTYADITHRNDIQKQLPLVIDDEYHSNNSHSIDIQTANNCAVHIVMETVFDINENYLSEKIFKPIVLKQPFIVFGPPNTLKTLQDMGFKTFGTFIDESYDAIEDHDARYHAAFNAVQQLCKQPLSSIQNMLQDRRLGDKVFHNYEWFYMQHTLDKVVDQLYRDINGCL
jgi:hypothetical protein